MEEINLKYPYCTSFSDDVKAYCSLVESSRRAYDHEKIEKSLEYSYMAATLAYRNSIRWKDLELERLITTISDSLCENEYLTSPVDSDNADLSVLFIASSLADHGGHSEVLGQWAEFLHNGEFTSDIHTIITNSTISKSEFPVLREKLDRYSSLDELCVTDKYKHRIRSLRKFIRQRDPDRIVLFIHPNDIIAFGALSSLRDEQTIIYYNHADHKFWLGVSLIDSLIDFRNVGQRVSRKYRDLPDSHIIPLTASSSSENSEGAFPNIPQDSSVSVSVGSFYKTRVDTGPDYFEILDNMLSKHASHHHVLVTNPPANIGKILSEKMSSRERLHVVGPYDSLNAVYNNADFLLETIPVAGGVVQKEAMTSGLPIVAYSCQEFPLLTVEEELPEGYEHISAKKEGILDSIDDFIYNNVDTDLIGKSLYHYYLQNFSNEVVCSKLQSVVRTPESRIDRKTSQEVEFDQEEYSKLLRNDYSVSYYLLKQSINKQTEFSIGDKMRFTANTIQTTLFKRPILTLGALVSLVLGNKGVTFGKKMMNKFR